MKLFTCDSCGCDVPVEWIATLTPYGAEGDFCQACRSYGACRCDEGQPCDWCHVMAAMIEGTRDDVEVLL